MKKEKLLLLHEKFEQRYAFGKGNRKMKEYKKAFKEFKKAVKNMEKISGWKL